MSRDWGEVSVRSVNHEGWEGHALLVIVHPTWRPQNSCDSKVQAIASRYVHRADKSRSSTFFAALNR